MALPGSFYRTLHPRVNSQRLSRLETYHTTRYLFSRIT